MEVDTGVTKAIVPKRKETCVDCDQTWTVEGVFGPNYRPHCTYCGSYDVVSTPVDE